MKKLLVYGANSAIAESLCRKLASDFDTIELIGRSSEKLEILKNDLSVRSGKKILTKVVAADALGESENIFSEPASMLVIAHGTLLDEELARTNPKYLEEQMQINLISYLQLCNQYADYSIKNNKPIHIVAFGSVAGDRSRQSNYLYGTAKNAIEFFLEGLRHKLQGTSSTVLCIKPGFVDTPMTSKIKKGPLFASPDKVANDIYKAIQKKKDTIYTPWFWYWIMFIIRSVPSFIFRKTKL
ncbi:MAG: SDR family NAD(P)-dependent oxidoreductase [Bdellovibrionales bacterium]